MTSYRELSVFSLQRKRRRIKTTVDQNISAWTIHNHSSLPMTWSVILEELLREERETVTESICQRGKLGSSSGSQPRKLWGTRIQVSALGSMGSFAWLGDSCIGIRWPIVGCVVKWFQNIQCQKHCSVWVNQTTSFSQYRSIIMLTLHTFFCFGKRFLSFYC